jgi:hypothetical protein
VVAAAVLAGGALTAATAGPAAAATYQQAPLTSIAYTDSLAPKQSFTNPSGPVPVGSWVDASGATHQSRVYLTFDLSSFSGTDVLGATLYAAESQVTQCQARSLEVWQSREPTQPITWHRAPDPETLLGAIATPASFCPAYYLHLDLTTAVHHAVAEGKSKLSLVLQVPADEQQNVSYGRWLDPSSFGLDVNSNIPPTVPTLLFNDGRACATTGPYPYLGETTPLLEAMFHDTDPGTAQLHGDFAIWPLDNPDNRTVFTNQYVIDGNEGGAAVPSGVLVNGETYAWQARGDDGIDQSPWSAPCYFRVDNSVPASGPAIASPNYPQNKFSSGGVPVIFDIGANGAKDVIGFQYSWNGDMSVFGYSIGPHGVPQWTDPFTQPGFVRADHPGGSVTLSLVPPPSWGPQTLTVESITRSYNISRVSTYQFTVGDTEPALTPSTTSPQYGVPFTIHLTPNPIVQKVDSYTYTVNNDPPQTVAAAPDGTATPTLTLNSSGGNVVRVTSHSVNGWVSSQATWFAFVDTTPTITSDVYPADGSGGGVGVTGTFTFASKVSNAASFSYSFDYAPETTVSVAADGTAQVTYTPTASGFHSLYVYTTGADGTVFDTSYYYFTVN